MPLSFDELLAIALSDSLDEEIKMIEKMEKVTPSPRMRFWIWKMKMKSAWRRSGKLLTRCAVLALVFFSAASLCVLTPQDVRATAKDILVFWTREEVTFLFDRNGEHMEAEEELTAVELTYLPEGFAIGNTTDELPFYCHKSWSNNKGQSFTLDCDWILEGGQISFHRHDHVESLIDLDKDNLLFFKSAASDAPHYLCWSENNYFISLAFSANFSDEEILKIAKGITFI